ncbi:hypothetical protein B6V73_16990 [Thioclava sp. JM3]|uniref:DUF3576 domain-containing protein n=1 Tax=Thioclava nitratireducens TaxID=1915078 RepID=A0ABM6ILE6_9RHOB|nr:MULTISPECIES: DUF3576 domain-containing protein [Thioclava]AQS49601.1 hypothetical protein BMG03_18730 [Thioclava nitratireducens]OWY07749.1 hypothetical protein B6V74_16310 [Thioclava sp. F42-5]OWY13484.1 hypothetical protein B6V73_16990 [Thioclava sp. JM3]PWE48911.1 DUF3576 domain-containing protein [Thioclava sp. NG1]
MTSRTLLKRTAILGLCLALAGCGKGISSGNIFSGSGGTPAQRDANQLDHLSGSNEAVIDGPSRRVQKKSTVWDLFSGKGDPNITVEVNKYLWQASLEVLDFLPIQEVDPFSGVIVTGYGTPPGGGRAYKATVYVTDPALDARSLKVSIRTRGGAVSADTQRAVENAILTRARQLRVRDSQL